MARQPRLAILLSTLQILALGEAAYLHAIEVGTWDMVSSSDPEWKHDRYTQGPGGGFTGYGSGTWADSPNNGNYTYSGSVTKSTCLVEDDGDVFVAMGWWFHDDMNHEKGKVKMACSYKTTKATTTAGVGMTSTFHQFVHNDLVATGTVPGDCPATAELAAKNGIPWMASGFSQDNILVFKCIKDCPAAVNCEGAKVITKGGGSTPSTDTVTSGAAVRRAIGSVGAAVLASGMLAHVFL